MNNIIRIIARTTGLVEIGAYFSDAILLIIQNINRERSMRHCMCCCTV